MLSARDKSADETVSPAAADWTAPLNGSTQSATGADSLAFGDQSDLSTSSSTGFALADAARHSFTTLADNATPFERGGAYAIFDAAGSAQYMGYSKNVAAKLVFHAQLQPALCSSFRVYLPSVPPELISPELLESVLEYWVRELGDVPRGNSVDRALWEQERPIDRKQEQTTRTDTQPTATQAAAATQTPPTSPPRSGAAASTAGSDADDVPVRERSTARRTAAQRSAEGVGVNTAAGFSVGEGAAPRPPSSEGVSSGWAASDEDYVEVEVDPLDPFSATKRRRTTRESWDEFDEVETREDWYPILMIAGFAGLVWLFGVLSNALPAATPAGGL